MSWNTSTPIRSTAAGSRVRGATTRTRAPITLSRRDVRARHPAVQHVAADRHRRGRRACPCAAGSSARRASACVGCSWLPSPALITGQSTFSDNSCTAPDSGWRTTSTSGCIAFSVIAVSISVSPLRIERDRDGHVDHVGAQPLAGDLERGAGAGRILEEAVDQRAAAQFGGLLFRLPAQLDIGVGQIEHMLDVLPAQPLDAEQVPVPKAVCLHEGGTIGTRPGGSKVGLGRVRGTYPELFRFNRFLGRGGARPYPPDRMILPMPALADGLFSAFP